MVFYGSNSSHLISKQTRQIPCPNCNQSTKFQIDIFGKYAHIYWIPFFPMGKKGAAQCTNCNAIYEPKQMDNALKMEYDNIKGEAKTPIKHFSAMGIIAVLVCGGIYSSMLADKNTEKYLAAPQVNDLYEFKTETNYYSTMKVAEVSDSIYFYVNNFETNKKSGITDIDKSNNYDTAKWGYTQEMLNKLYKDNVIYEIDRD